MTVTTSTPPAATVLQILKMMYADKSIAAIALATDVAPGDVESIAKANGWPDETQLNNAISRLEQTLAHVRPGPKPGPPPAPTSRARAAEVTLDSLLKELLQSARLTGNTELRSAADRAEVAVSALQEAMAHYEARREQIEEAKRLKEQAAAACARAGIPDKEGDQLIRAWAKRQKIEVNSQGLLSKKVRDAYVAAHSKKGPGQ